MRQTFTSKVVGPHFERLCRDWARWYAAPETFGGYPARVGSGAINDRSGRMLLETDVVVLGDDGASQPQVLGLGEAKWNTVMTPGHLERLARVRGLLREHKGLRATDDTRLMLFSAAGFTDELRERAERESAVVLVSLDRLYEGG
jgi:hypothetical protein